MERWVEGAALDFSLQNRAAARIKVRNAAGILEALRRRGVHPDEVLRRAGVDPAVFRNPNNDLPYAALGRIVGEGVKATGCESLGLAAGDWSGATAAGLPALVALNAPTVRDALQVFCASLKASDTGGVAVIEERARVALLNYAVIAPDIEASDQIVDGAMAIAFHLMRALCNPAWRPTRVRLTRDPPLDKAPFAKLFGAPIEFGAPAAALVFDAATLDAPVAGRNPHYADILAPLLAAAADSARSDFLMTVKSIIRSQIGAGALSRDSVCRALNLNARTLAHRLEARGITYSALAEEAKFDAARRFLQGGKPIAEIATLLGFSEPSAFTRAFKAWSGATPARWRAGRALLR